MELRVYRRPLVRSGTACLPRNFFLAYIKATLEVSKRLRVRDLAEIKPEMARHFPSSGAIHAGAARFDAGVEHM